LPQFNTFSETKQRFLGAVSEAESGNVLKFGYKILNISTFCSGGKWWEKQQRKDAKPQRRKKITFLIFSASLRLGVFASIPSVALV